MIIISFLDDDELDTNNELVLHQPSASKAVVIKKLDDRFDLSESKDEYQIMKELEGQVIKEYVYQFKAGGKTVKSISYAGIKAIISRRGNMRIVEDEVIKDEKDGLWYAKVKIHDIVRNLDGVGISECEINKPFARRIAFSKAMRNAYRSIIDEALIVAMIKEWERTS